MGVLARIMTGLAAAVPDNRTSSIAITSLQAHRTAYGLRSKKEGMNVRSTARQMMSASPRRAKLHAVTDVAERMIRFVMTACDVSDHAEARIFMSSLRKSDWLLAD
jgi:hypothetical protein